MGGITLSGWHGSVIMPDPAFEAWLRDLPQLGYDRDWIRRNLPALERRYAENPAPMPPCPAAPVAVRDRYEEL